MKTNSEGVEAMCDHAKNLRSHAAWLRHGDLDDGSDVFESAAFSCEAGARAIEELEVGRDLIPALTRCLEDCQAARRLMARPRLAPEQVEKLRSLMDMHDGWIEAVDALRAALAALGEPAP